MAKAILEFDLSDPSEREDHKVALNAYAYKFAIEDFDNELRFLIKYNSESLTKKEYELVTKLREQLNSILTDRLGD